MATCFDRKTVIIRPIKKIFKVQESEQSIGSHFVYSKSYTVKTYAAVTFTVNEMGSHWVLTLLYCTLKMFFIGLMMTVLRSNMLP